MGSQLKYLGRIRRAAADSSFSQQQSVRLENN